MAHRSLTGVYFRGNAPRVGSYAFDDDIKAIGYYLPGTIGWGTTVGGQQGRRLPTELWTPRVQTRDASFGVQSNQFGFTINWANSMTVVVEASTNLADPIWLPVGTNTLVGGSSDFSERQWTNYPDRFYRLRSP